MHNCIPNIYLYGQYIFHAQHLFAQETDSQIVKKLTGINCQSREGILAETGGHNANDDNSEWSINQNTISTVHGYGDFNPAWRQQHQPGQFRVEFR